MNTAAQLYQAITGQPHPLTVTEHPVRCAARLSLFSFAAAEGEQRHTHECIHPARRPDGVIGVLEHQCHCGATWSERASAGGTKTSGEEDQP